MRTTLLVDSHVHYHACFEVEPFLEAAASNFQAARLATGAPDAIGCLMFAENAWVHAFRAFAGGMVEREAPGWSVKETAEDCSVVVLKDGAAPIVIVAGRQVVAAERLEVLALATCREFPDGLPFPDALESVISSGAIPVVPWGFGKWTGTRGRTVRELLTSDAAESVFLGDNGGRPDHFGDPGLFGLARERGVPILPGSDPLPLPPEVRKPGRLGFVLEGAVDLQAPGRSIRSLLAERPQPRVFGRLEGLGTFLLRQTQLRLRRGDTNESLRGDVKAGMS